MKNNFFIGCISVPNPRRLGKCNRLKIVFPIDLVADIALRCPRPKSEAEGGASVVRHAIENFASVV